MMNTRDKSHILDINNFSHLDVFFVLTIGGPFSARWRLAGWRSRTLEIPVLFKVAVRKVTIVLRKFAIVDSLREVLDTRFREWAGEYFNSGSFHVSQRG